jgi:hypothetical protein
VEGEQWIIGDMVTREISGYLFEIRNDHGSLIAMFVVAQTPGGPIVVGPAQSADLRGIFRGDTRAPNWQYMWERWDVPITSFHNFGDALRSIPEYSNYWVDNKVFKDLEYAYTVHEDNLRNLMDPFKIGEWNSKSDKERREAIEEIAKYITTMLGIRFVGKEFPIIEYPKPGTGDECAKPGVYGCYDGTTNVIKLNYDNLKDPYEALKSICHEMTHAYQDYVYVSDPNRITNEEVKDAYKAVHENKSIDSQKNPMRYRLQLHEIEARMIGCAMQNFLEIEDNRQPTKVCW